MSWWEANAARRGNIGRTVSSISQQAHGIAQGREAKERRKQEAQQHLSEMFQKIAQRKHETGEREGAQDWGTGERVGAQEYGTGERVAGEDFTTSEREAGQKFKTEFQFPFEIGRARAGRAEQSIYAGGNDKLVMFDKGFDSWVDKAGAQHPDWFIKDEYGETVGYQIPDEGWGQFRQYMKTMYGTDDADVQAYIDSIRASQEEPAPVTEGAQDIMGQYAQPEKAPDTKVSELLREIPQLEYVEGMGQGERYLLDTFRQYEEGGWTEDERNWLLEMYPQLMQMVDTYKVTAAQRAQSGVRAPGRGR